MDIVEPSPVSDNQGKILILGPRITTLNSMKENPIDYLQGEELTIHLSEAFELNSQKADIEIELFEPKLFQATDGEKLYAIGILRKMVAEIMLNKEFNIFPTDYFLIEKIKKEYQIDRLLWTYGVTLKFDRDLGFASVVAGTMLSAGIPVIFPIWIYFLVSPGYRSYHTSYLFDLNSWGGAVLESRMRSLKLGKRRSNRIAKKTMQYLRNQ